MRNFSLGEFQALILLFSQALLVQVAFYPLVIFNIIKRLPSVLTNPKIYFGILLILFAAISIFMRGASIDFGIILLRFYCGIILVIAAFTVNKNLQITHTSFWIFSLFVFYEYISLMLGLTPFTYKNFINIGIEDEIEGRIFLANNVVRAVGPTMNSSVSGSILAIMLFYILIGRKKFLLFKRKTLQLSVALFTAFMLCGSGTAMVAFVLLLLTYVVRGRASPVGKFNFKVSTKLVVIFLVLLIPTLTASYIYLDFLGVALSSKWSVEYFMLSINYKLLQVVVLDDLQTVFFGANLAGSSPISSGGDFILLSFVYHFGLIYVSAFIAYLFYICKSENRLFVFVGLVTSMHYGTIFTLAGQAFFGALVVGSVFSKEFLQHRVELIDVKIVKP